jgi:hypothetical protein
MTSLEDDGAPEPKIDNFFFSGGELLLWLVEFL